MPRLSLALHPGLTQWNRRLDAFRDCLARETSSDLAGWPGPGATRDSSHANFLLLPRLHLRRDEADVIHACLMADVEHVRHRGEVQVWIPLTNMTFSARVAKMPSSLFNRSPWETSSLIDLVTRNCRRPMIRTWTTMVRSLSCCFCGFFGGCGTKASRPFGVTGVMTMKMINSTSSTSISGVTLMSWDKPPPLPTRHCHIRSLVCFLLSSYIP